MNKMPLFLFALGTVAFTACSSLDVNQAESMAENYPKDFVAADYMALHPGLRSLQIQDYVKDYNSKLSLDKSLISEDSAAFLADTSLLHRIYVNPIYAGYSEELWAEDWDVSISEKKDCDTCAVVLDTTAGGIPSDKRRQLIKFNFHDTLDDLAALEAVPVDTFAISSQYLMFGQAHGWAYRACSDAERNNPIQSEEYPMKKLYCADGDVVREIAE